MRNFLFSAPLSRLNEKRLELLLICCAVLSAVTAPKRIWIDEFLVFAFAGFSTCTEMLHHLQLSFRDLNVGQTGTLFLLTYFLLKILGASYLAFRLPSFLAFGASLWFFLRLLRGLGISFPLRVCLLFWLAFDSWTYLMAIDLRPYIVIQASVLGFLTCLLPMPGEIYSLRFRSLFGATLLGILVHPYFPLYAGLAFPFACALFPEVRAAITHYCKLHFVRVLAALVFLGSLLLTVGYFSWFHNESIANHAAGSFDPYFYIGHEQTLFRITVGTLYAPVGKYIFLLFLALPAFVFFSKTPRFREGASRLRVALTNNNFLFYLLLLASTQFVLIWSSIHSGYWILARQWIAGFPIALLLFAALLQSCLDSTQNAFLFGQKKSLGVLAAVLVLLIFTHRIFTNITHPLQPKLTRETYEQAFRDGRTDLWEDLADFNLKNGGPVRPEFANYYRRMNPNSTVPAAN
ncbi:MAG: hypothetical protein ACXWQO_01785 [Bdellovibrionota bacterium]